MNIREMHEADIALVVPLYLDYYNGREGAAWTAEKATVRIHQVVCMEGGYSLILENEGEIIGFAMGYFKQYDDIVSYMLEEILIASQLQDQGLGSQLLQELMQRVKDKGAALMELLSVNDEMHDAFYGKAGFYTAKSHAPKGKWLT